MFNWRSVNQKISVSWRNFTWWRKMKVLWTRTAVHWHQRAGTEAATTLPSGVRWWMKKGWCLATGCGQCFMLPSVLWHCWLDNRKDSQSIKKLAPFMHHLSPKDKWMKKTEGNTGRGLPRFTWKMAVKVEVGTVTSQLWWSPCVYDVNL